MKRSAVFSVQQTFFALEPVFIGKMCKFLSIILLRTRVRVSCGHLCETEASTEITLETRKSENMSYDELFQRSHQQNLPKRCTVYPMNTGFIASI